MAYPRVLTEHDTLRRVLAGASIARYGDGELRVALGRKCVSQEADPKLAAELRAILADDRSGCMAAIPNVDSATPRRESWSRFAAEGFTRLYGRKVYGSSFITRPDSAPWIDEPVYWDMVEALWRGKDAVLAIGDMRSLRPEMLRAAKSLRVVQSVTKHAYREIDRVEEEIGRPSGPVLMCLGCTATALAARLARKGVHGIDIGHIGMFMRAAGAYRYVQDDLISPEYRAQLVAMHNRGKWGHDGGKHVEAVMHLVSGEMQPATILDYGCGGGKLREALAAMQPPRRVMEYDAGVPNKGGMPKPVDLAVCTDVLEHVEPDKLPAVLDHIRRLALKGCYFVIATRPAKAVLPDGRNAHLIVEDAAWWHRRLCDAGFDIVRAEGRPGKEVRIWTRR